MSLFLHLYLLPLRDSTSRQSQGGKHISLFSLSLGRVGEVQASVAPNYALAMQDLLPWQVLVLSTGPV